MSLNIKSSLWMLFACLNFAALNTLVKILSTNYSISQIIFFRALFAILFLLPWIFNLGLSCLKTKSWKTQFLRCMIALAAMYLWFYSIANIPLAKATAINFIAPIFGAIFAIFFLNEKIKIRRFSAILVSFLGSIIIIRPGIIQFDYFIGLALIASILMGMASVFIKKLSDIDHPIAVVFYMPLFLALSSFLPCMYSWKFPNMFDLILLIGTGLTAALAHQGITKAFSKADASFVLAFDYFRLPITAILAFYLFDEVTSIWIWIGSIIIFLSSIYIIYREKAVGQKTVSSVLSVKKVN
tara:strand:- start:1669 stop:2562 length:894 start_codon:yes stop_codon:yes gene_type:complete